MVDVSNLTEKLEELKGYDFEAVEKEERTAGNIAVNISMTPSFQSRLAARALGVNPHDIKELPLKKYSKVMLEVFSFLFGGSEETEVPPKESKA